MKLGTHPLGSDHPAYVIAEIGSNHNGDLDLAKTMIDKAKDCGAHCVKFQSWTKDTIFSRTVYEENHFLKDDYRDRDDYTLEAIVDAFSVSEDELRQLADHCHQVGIDFASTPFSWRELDFLCDELQAPFVKVASMDCNNYPFLAAIAAKGRPVVLSTGLSHLSEIDRAVRTLEENGCTDICLLHCIANYPPLDEHVNLRNMQALSAMYPDIPVGFSDHSLGTEIPLAAAALGAVVIEKHFTLDKEMFGWDHKVSADEAELRHIVTASGRIHTALGSRRRTLSAADEEKKPAFRRSIVAAREITAGATITRDDLELKRPGTGLPPEWLDFLIGRTARRDVAFDRMLSTEDV